jgi:hypothetical protein
MSFWIVLQSDYFKPNSKRNQRETYRYINLWCRPYRSLRLNSIVLSILMYSLLLTRFNPEVYPQLYGAWCGIMTNGNSQIGLIFNKKNNQYEHHLRVLTNTNYLRGSIVKATTLTAYHNLCPSTHGTTANSIKHCLFNKCSLVNPFVSDEHAC